MKKTILMIAIVAMLFVGCSKENVYEYKVTGSYVGDNGYKSYPLVEYTDGLGNINSYQMTTSSYNFKIITQSGTKLNLRASTQSGLGSRSLNIYILENGEVVANKQGSRSPGCLVCGLIAEVTYTTN